MIITIYQHKFESHRLAFVKAMKDLTGFGLKEAKGICDEINSKFKDGNISSITVDISNTIGDKIQLVRDFTETLTMACTGCYSTDVISARETSLLAIGIGSKEDYVESITKLISYSNRDKISDIVKFFLEKYSEDEIKDIYPEISSILKLV